MGTVMRFVALFLACALTGCAVGYPPATYLRLDSLPEKMQADLNCPEDTVVVTCSVGHSIIFTRYDNCQCVPPSGGAAVIDL